MNRSGPNGARGLVAPRWHFRQCFSAHPCRVCAHTDPAIHRRSVRSRSSRRAQRTASGQGWPRTFLAVGAAGPSAVRARASGAQRAGRGELCAAAASVVACSLPVLACGLCSEPQWCSQRLCEVACTVVWQWLSCPRKRDINSWRDATLLFLLRVAMVRVQSYRSTHNTAVACRNSVYSYSCTPFYFVTAVSMNRV